MKVATGVIAALSPNTLWTTNVYDADALLAAVRTSRGESGAAAYYELKVSTYNTNKLKAWTIAEQTGPVLDTLSGPKVTAFYRNLIGDHDALTLDSHAYNAYCGFRATGSDLPGMRAAIEREARRAYERAASTKQETISAFQAIIWVTWKARIDAGKVAGYGR